MEASTSCHSIHNTLEGNYIDSYAKVSNKLQYMWKWEIFWGCYWQIIKFYLVQASVLWQLIVGNMQSRIIMQYNN